MGNEEQVSLLKQGVESWNNWREENSDTEIDLSDANLRGADLSGADLSSAILSDADLHFTDLYGAKLSGADLSGADLYCADLSGANLHLADLSKAKLNGAKLNGSKLSDANLRSADLSGAKLSDANLHSADLSGAIISNQTQIGPKWQLVHNLVNEGGEGKDLSYVDLSGAFLVGVNLISANLSDANLSGAKLSGAYLSGAYLSGANLSKAILSDTYLRNADLSDANLRNADLSSAHLKDANLSCTKLIYANLSDADLRNADLRGANLSDANLIGANLSDASLIGAQLRDSVLILVQAAYANFIHTVITGACIEDWNINLETDFEGVKCDYIYRSYNYDQDIFTDRLPVNSDRVFQAGEFEEWIRISSEAQQTIDLTFTEGIDWQAFFQSLQGVRQEYPGANVGLQAIEEKGTVFVIRLKTSSDADQGAIEATVKELYDTQFQLQDARGEIRVLREWNDYMKLLAGEGMNKPTNQTTIHAKTIGVHHSGSGDIKEFSQNIGNQADEITQLINSLRNLAQSFPEEQQEVIEGELEDLEHDVKTPDYHQPKRISRKLKRLRQAGTAVLALAGTTVVSGVAFTDNANKFVENIDKLGDKLGIEIIQDKQLDK